MALVAKMAASEVNQRGGGRWVACEEGDDGAVAVAGVNVGSMYGTPPWLSTTGWVRYEDQAQNSEQIKLTTVSAKDADDPNREWPWASLSGSLELFIQNPASFGYVLPGGEYRITIERIRGPRLAPTGSGV